MDHIINNLWLGSQLDADQLVRKNPDRITAILNVRGPDAYQPPGRDQSADHPGKAYKWIPAPDTGLISPEHLSQGLGWLEEKTESRARILIHCMHGISRSPGFLAAFMVKSRMSPSLQQAKAVIAAHRPVHPATEIPPPGRRVVLTSALTGLPNRQALNDGPPSPFLAVVDVDLMKTFNDSFGQIAGDALLCRLAAILTSVGLDTYHQEGDEFLCKGETRQELSDKLSTAREIFKQSFQLYADGRIQAIEGTDFSFGIGATPAEQAAALHDDRKAKAHNDCPEWLRKIVDTAGHGQVW